MNKAVVIGIIIAMAIGIAVSVTLYSGGLSQSESVETEDVSESKPKQFSVELNEGIGISDKQP